MLYELKSLINQVKTLLENTIEKIAIEALQKLQSLYSIDARPSKIKSISKENIHVAKAIVKLP